MSSPLPSPPGFRGTWKTGPEARALSGLVSGPFRGTAEAWASPTDADDLSLLLRHAARVGASLVPRGAGTAMPGGNLGPGIVVSLTEGFTAQGPVRESEGTGDGTRNGARFQLRVEAGVPATRVEALADQAGLRFPPLPSSARWATLGGMVATNAAGAHSFGRGAVSTWVHEVEGVDARGEPFRLGPDAPLPGTMADALRRLARGLPPAPRVRKNSSGYGLDRFLATGNPAQLLIGSEGTLGFVTAVTLRLEPRPPFRGVRLLPVGTAAEAAVLAVEAGRLGAVAAEFLGGRLLDMAGLRNDPELGPLARGAFALFLLEFEGESGEGVEAALEEAASVGRALAGEGLGTRDPEVARALWELRHRASPLISDQAARGLISTQFIEDSVVPPERLGDYLLALDRILAEEGRGTDAVVFGHAGDGNVHVNPLVEVGAPDWKDRVRAILEAVVEEVATLGGTLAGEHGDGRLRAPFLERIWGPEHLRAFQAVKAGFDPEGRLNPGVILPLPGQDPLEDLHPRPRDWPR